MIFDYGFSTKVICTKGEHLGSLIRSLHEESLKITLTVPLSFDQD